MVNYWPGKYNEYHCKRFAAGNIEIPRGLKENVSIALGNSESPANLKKKKTKQKTSAQAPW